MIDRKKQPPLKSVMLTGLLTISLAGFSASVFAQPDFIDSVLVFEPQQGGGGNPVAECAEHDALYFAKYDWEGGAYVKSPDSVGDVTIVGNEISGTWSSTTEIAVMIVKGGTLRDPTIYDPPPPGATNGSYDNTGIDGKDISHITFCVRDGGSQVKGVCVLDFDKTASYNPYPLYFNGDGWFDHGNNLDPNPTGTVTRFLSCYQNQTKEWCESQIGSFLTPPNANVTSAHWYDVDTCNELMAAKVLPTPVKLEAEGVDLTATKNDSNGVDLTLTTDSETDTAKLLILRGIELENGGTEIEIACDGKEFNSGSSPYTCTDTPAADSYRAAEKEYDGSFIVYDEVKPKK